MAALWNLVSAHGGIVAAVVTVLVLFNIVLGAASQIFKALGKSVPGWVGKALVLIAKALDFLQANVQHK
jgi:hypothetical protein